MEMSVEHTFVQPKDSKRTGSYLIWWWVLVMNKICLRMDTFGIALASGEHVRHSKASHRHKRQLQLKPTTALVGHRAFQLKQSSSRAVNCTNWIFTEVDSITDTLAQFKPSYWSHIQSSATFQNSQRILQHVYRFMVTQVCTWSQNARADQHGRRLRITLSFSGLTFP